MNDTIEIEVMEKDGFWIAGGVNLFGLNLISKNKADVVADIPLVIELLLKENEDKDVVSCVLEETEPLYKYAVQYT